MSITWRRRNWGIHAIETMIVKGKKELSRSLIVLNIVENLYITIWRIVWNIWNVLSVTQLITRSS